MAIMGVMSMERAPVRKRKRSQHMAMLIAKRRMMTFRRVLEGGCVLLHPGHYFVRASGYDDAVRMHENFGDQWYMRGASREFPTSEFPTSESRQEDANDVSIVRRWEPYSGGLRTELIGCPGLSVTVSKSLKSRERKQR
jgi:hypothetical protein